MLKPSNAIGGIVTLVIFFALIAVSTVIYSGDPEQKVRVEQNFFWRNAKVAVDSVWIAVQGIADIGLGKDVSQPSTTASVAQAVQESGALEEVGTAIKEEWEKDGGAGIGDIAEPKLEKFWEWRRTASGAEVVFKDKEGGEHIVSLPFSFLASE